MRPIGFLPPGTKVTLIGLEDQIEDAVVRGSTHSATTISCRQKRMDHWVSDPHHLVSNGTQVELRTEAAELPEPEPELVTPVSESEEPTSEPKKVRGRKRKEYPPLRYPEGEFDMNKLALFNGLTYTAATVLFKREGKAKFVREVKGGKGRARKIYVVDNS